MSIPISCLLIFYLLCLHMHSCIARHLGVMDDTSNQKLHFSNRVLSNKRDKGPIVSSVQEETNGIIFHVTRSLVNLKVKDDQQSDRDSLLYVKKTNESEMAGMTNSKPLVSAPGFVSPKNLDERTGFFSDYSRPRTHPPSHN